MFQPRATPQFVSFPANYGVRDELAAADYSGFSLGLHGPPPAGHAVGVSAGGGPTPLGLFSPAAYGSSVHHPSSFNTNPNMAEPADLKSEPSAPDDLAAQEAAARDYEPQLEGEPVGEKLPSHVITEEYAKADPTYVAKTLALPQTYSHYRPIQGDGNCGWRAIGFSYFETLINRCDEAKITAELERISRLDQYILDVGRYDPYVYEDMVEETKTVFRDILGCLPHADAATAVLRQKFNDPESANAIIYHLRLLAASYLKGNVGPYQGFIQGGGGVQGFCQEWIERPGREIDHMGISLLSDVLLKPAGFVLEIAYLDRSEGDQVNIYRFPDEANNQDASSLGPTMYLLFRPDHYDILYRPGPVDLQVNRAAFSHRLPISTSPASMQTFADGLDLGVLTILPGFGGPPTGMSPLDTPTYTPSPQSPWHPQPSFPETFVPQQPAPTATGPLPAPVVGRVTRHPLRFSRWQYPELLASAALPEPSCTTQTFKNSHFNTAHYNNPNFQPEEYKPEAEESPEPTPRAGRKKSIKSASTHLSDD